MSVDNTQGRVNSPRAWLIPLLVCGLFAAASGFIVVAIRVFGWSATGVREWAAVGANGLGGVTAVTAAVVALLAIRAQVAANSASLSSQQAATQIALEHQRRLGMEERIWHRRADLYEELIAVLLDPGGAERDPFMDIDEYEASVIVSGLAHSHRPRLIQMHARLTSFASQDVIDAVKKHIESCADIEFAVTHQLDHEDPLTRDQRVAFNSTHKHIEEVVRSELAGQISAAL